MKKFFALFFPDIARGESIKREILESYGVRDLADIGLRIEGRGTIVADPAKIAALKTHRELLDKAHRLIKDAA